MKKGYTLLELLVVVLIIGILAAVAVPQYQTAVDRSRMSQAMVLGRALRDAQQRYYMANGQYTLNINDLDISIPGDCRISSDSSDAYSQSSLICAEGYTVSLTSSNNVLASLEGISGLVYPFASSSGYSICYALSSSSRGDKVCRSLGCVYNNTNSTNGNRFYNCN